MTPPGAWSEAEAKASFLLRLRANGVANIDILRAMEGMPRLLFVPDRDARLAARDIALPLGCGQTMARPSFVARSLDALGCAETHRVLEIGSGSGFVTALLARLAHSVVGIERYRGLAAEAHGRLADIGLRNASIVWDDGLALPPGEARFDRIILQAAVREAPSSLLAQLAPGGLLLYPLLLAGEPGHAGRQMMVRAGYAPDGVLRQERLFASRLQDAQAGRSAVL